MFQNLTTYWGRFTTGNTIISKTYNSRESDFFFFFIELVGGSCYPVKFFIHRESFYSFDIGCILPSATVLFFLDHKKLKLFNNFKLKSKFRYRRWARYENSVLINVLQYAGVYYYYVDFETNDNSPYSKNGFKRSLVFTQMISICYVSIIIFSLMPTNILSNIVVL